MVIFKPVEEAETNLCYLEVEGKGGGSSDSRYCFNTAFTTWKKPLPIVGRAQMGHFFRALDVRPIAEFGGLQRGTLWGKSSPEKFSAQDLREVRVMEIRSAPKHLNLKP